MRRLSRPVRAGERGHRDRRTAHQTDIAAFIRTANPMLPVAGEFSLYQAAAAHTRVDDGSKLGIVVVASAR